MAINFCALCNDPCTGANAGIGNINSQETWRTLVAQALCGLVSNTPGVAATTLLGQTVYTAAELQADFAAYTDTELLDSTGKLKYLKVINNTDANLEFSADGGTTTHFLAIANAITEINVGNVTVADPTDFVMRRQSGSAAGTGSVYLEGYY